MFVVVERTVYGDTRVYGPFSTRDAADEFNDECECSRKRRGDSDFETVELEQPNHKEPD